eukprot:gene12224-biopygen3323
MVCYEGIWPPPNRKVSAAGLSSAPARGLAGGWRAVWYAALCCLVSRAVRRYDRVGRAARRYESRWRAGTAG